MKEIAIFGAGNYGNRAMMSYIVEGRKVAYFVDNMKAKWGELLLNIPIISPARFAEINESYHLVIAVNVKFQKQIEKQILELGIEDYEIFDFKRLSEQERLISYSEKDTLEDVILYHVLKDESNIFYIDVGSNDPFEHSVTKLLYDMKGAKGINIEPQKGFFNLIQKERPKDINLCIGVGSKRGKMKFFYQEGYSTVIKENVIDENCYYEEIEIITLKDICDKYLEKDREISFLKVDVEGAEYDVLAGGDFVTYRPWIVVVESTEPGTQIPNYDKWENILLSNNYHFVLQVGVNRYYVANEKRLFDNRFCGKDKLNEIYNIYYAALQL